MVVMMTGVLVMALVWAPHVSYVVVEFLNRVHDWTVLIVGEWILC